MTTKKMEEFFNLPPLVEPDEEVTEIIVSTPVKTKETLFTEAQDIMTSITTADKVDSALPMVTGLEVHDNEMDDIAKKAVQTFEDLITLGGNVPDLHAGKIFEVAGQMLKTALDAKNAKADKKLKMLELQLKKIRAEQIDFENGSGPARTGGQGAEFDRNELLRHIISSKSERPDK